MFPTPNLHDDEVLIKVKLVVFAALTPIYMETDEEGYIIFSGLTKLPCIIGHEFSGIVEKDGQRKNLKEATKLL